ncbi:MAG: phosphodiesterase [Gammaproteobacteria bacterium]|nr:MAG: phosphodiesterase [Gammaproteobacteria bacterium]
MKIIQISDTHLFATEHLTMFGVKTNIKLQEVIKNVTEEEIDADMIFLTGDISQDETFQSYQKAVHYFSKLNIPIYWIPGNHDNVTQMEAAFKSDIKFIRTEQLSLPNWDFIFLNTKKEGTGLGYLSESDLQRLKNKLSITADKNIAIIMHHHPIEVGTPLIDHYILQNKSEFWDIVAGTQVKLIMCGHVHGDYKLKYQNIMIESAPATCLQLQKGTQELKIDNQIGFKIYFFDENTYHTISKMWLGNEVACPSHPKNDLISTSSF